ncbi:MAG: DUF2125 domain-containing protein [Roseobacter sp.]
MRRLIWLVIFCAVLWGAWWFFAATTVQMGILKWFEHQRSLGWQAEVARVDKSGFPLNLNLRLAEPALADPRSGIAFSTRVLDVNAPVWWPGYASILFPQDEMILASPLERKTITATQARADLRLHPGFALELEELALTSEGWLVSSPEGSLMGAQGLSLKMTQSETSKGTYAFTLTAPGFRLGDVVRRNLRIPDDWPIFFDNLQIDMTVLFDRPFDRSTVETARPQPRHIDLNLAEITWGGLLLRGAADLAVASGGILSGDVTLQARNWREMIALAETTGVLPPSIRAQAENILAALAQGSGNPDTLDVTLSLRDGSVFLGFFPLGSAPRLVLR